MKRSPFLFPLLIFLISNCTSSVDTSTAFTIAGAYELIWYSSATVSDDNPSGTMQASEVDATHVNLVVKGQSGKVNLNYSYTNVLVSYAGTSNSGQTTYNLTYKNRVIGSALVDGVSRSLILTPSNTLRIEGLNLA